MEEGGEKLTQGKLPSCEFQLPENEVFIKYDSPLYLSKGIGRLRGDLRARISKNPYNNRVSYTALNDAPVYRFRFWTLKTGEMFGTEKNNTCRTLETARKKQITSA